MRVGTAATGTAWLFLIVCASVACRVPNPAYDERDSGREAGAASDAAPLGGRDAAPVIAAPDGAPPATQDAAPQPDGPAGRTTALVVVDDPARLYASDRQIIAALEELGFAVVTRSEAAVTIADADGASLIFVAPSTASDLYQGRLKDVRLPTIIGESYTLDDMGMTGPVSTVDFGHGADQRIVITMPEHPLAGGQSGAVMAFDTVSAAVGWGVPSAAAIVVAHYPMRPDRATLFGYEAGARMVNGVAPARRVGMFAGNIAGAGFSTAAMNVVRGAIKWAAGR